MSITVRQLRDLIEGLPDDREVLIIEHMADTAAEMAYAKLVGVECRDGHLYIEVEIGEYDDDDEDDWDEDDDGAQAPGSTSASPESSRPGVKSLIQSWDSS